MNTLKAFLKKTALYPIWQKFKLELADNRRALIYVHIEKCGGISLWDAIKDSKIINKRFSDISRVHVSKVPLRKRTKYLIVLRNPISRAISAFNWRCKLVVDDKEQVARFKEEYDVLLKYKSLNALAEALYKDGTLNENVGQEFRAIHHLREDIAFYLEDLLDHIKPKQIYKVFTTKSLDDDMEQELGVKKVEKVHENRSSTDDTKLNLSDEARANLKRFLHADYGAIEKLLSFMPLSNEKYDELMR